MTGAKSGNVAFKAGSYRERFVTVMGFSIILTDYKDNDERVKESGLSLHFNHSIIPIFSTMPVKSFTHFSISQKTIMYCIVETSHKNFLYYIMTQKNQWK